MEQPHDTTNIPHHMLGQALYVDPAHSILTDAQVLTTWVLWSHNDKHRVM